MLAHKPQVMDGLLRPKKKTAFYRAFKAAWVTNDREHITVTSLTTQDYNVLMMNSEYLYNLFGTAIGNLTYAEEGDIIPLRLTIVDGEKIPVAGVA